MKWFESAGRARPAPGACARRRVAALLAFAPLLVHAQGQAQMQPQVQPHAQPPLLSETRQAPLSLAEAVQIATTQSRRVVAAELQAQAARDMAVAAAQRPDPVLKFGLINLPIDGADRFSLTSDFMTMRSVGVMQELTRGEKRQARGQRAQREVEAALLARTQAVSELQRDTALVWLERSYQHLLRDLLLAQVREAELQVQAAQALVGSGKASQADVFAARNQVEQVRDSVAQADRSIAVASTRLARWIGEAAQRDSGPRPVLAVPSWAASPDLAPHLAQHAQIAVAAQQTAIARADVEVAEAERRPDWSVELMFSQRGPGYSNMVSVNVSLPLQWNQAQRQGRDVAARHALAARSAAELEDLQRAHEAEVRAMLQEWHSHEQRLQRYGSVLLPLAQQRSHAALTAYRAGSGALSAVLEARRAEIDVQIERLRIEMELARLWAQFAYLDGQGSAVTPEATP